MFLLVSILAIGFFAWVQYQLVPVPANAPEGLGMVVWCILFVIFGAFLLYLAHVDLMVGEWTAFNKYTHVEHVVTPDDQPARFWFGIAWRFGMGTYLIGAALALPLQKRA